jgi:hypothetical protein
MSAERRIRLWGLAVAEARSEPVEVRHMCAVAITASGVDSVAVTMTSRATPRETLYASDGVAADLAELAITLGEGPDVDALLGGPVLVADLAAAECRSRWPMYAPAAVKVGGRAAFALPLQVGAVGLGVLDLYRTEPGELNRGQLADALTLADMVCAVLLDGAGRDRLDGVVIEPETAGMHHPEVHQATGMIIVQLGVTAEVALVRLRAYAYANDRRLRDVAGDVVARRLRFDDET